MPKYVIATDNAPRPTNPISQATKSGGFIFTQGLLGRTLDGKLVAGVEGQARQIMVNLQAILAAAGASMNDVMRCEVCVVQMADMADFNQVWNEYFAEEPPARSVVEVRALGGGALVEVTAIAHAG